jgi:cation:H+ antiporter
MTAQYLRERSGAADAASDAASPDLPMAAEIPRRTPVSLLLAVAGLGGLLYGGDLFVQGAVRMAEYLGVSKGLIGLTVVAIGTSLPELATSAVASWRGHSQVAYGNILGSNLFNLLGILGCAVVAGPVSMPPIMVWVDGPVMIAATGVMLYFLASGQRLTRPEAAAMLAAYVAYVAARYVYALA